jgi:diguanylate cyclase (GGDEF)-like protein
MTGMDELAAQHKPASSSFEQRVQHALLAPQRVSLARKAKAAIVKHHTRLQHYVTLLRQATTSDAAIISIVEDDKQLFPIALGLPQAILESPITHCLCKYAIAEKQRFYVHHAKSDPHVCDNGAVTDFGVSTYLGHPIILYGHAVGTLAAVNFSETDIDQPAAAVAEHLAHLLSLELTEMLREPSPAGDAMDTDLLKAVLDTIPETIICVDETGKVHYANHASALVFASVTVGSSMRDWDQNFDPHDEAGKPLSTHDLPLSRALRGELVRDFCMQVFDRSKGSEPRWYSVSATPVGMGAKADFGAVALVHDITERKNAEAALSRAMRSDHLTGLVNRRGFFESAPKILENARRERCPFLIVYADLDRLKQLNDQHGHAHGDLCLRATAKLLQEALGEHAIVARLGGDEFAAAIASFTPEHVIEALLKARDALHLEPIGAHAPIFVSVGHSVITPDDPRSLDQALSEADSLMYARKRAR